MIDLSSELNFKNASVFPVQNSAATRELLTGALWLLVPFIGWLMNLGHRIVVVHKLQRGLPPWPSWDRKWVLLKHGFVAWVGVTFYYVPAALLAILAYLLDKSSLHIAAIALVLLATLAIPGYMIHYCKEFDPREIFDPFRALGRAIEGGAGYWRAWFISFTALLLSFLGLLLLCIGFLATSVWFWQVAGYSFANVFSRIASESPSTLPAHL